ncbi:MAG: heme exporter protein CcmD [Hydrogenophilales bacterium]|nr:heme exporter protein CcmD [Hydrogenophilales bacterium]
MNWGSWSNFIDMGGRGFYVWGSYLITLVCIALELGLLARHKRTLWQHLTQIMKLNKQG